MAMKSALLQAVPMNDVPNAKIKPMSKGSAIFVMAMVLAVSIASHIEGIYISVLFGLRLVIILRLSAGHYPLAALLEAALVSVNPGNSIFTFEDPNAYQAHLIGIVTSYLSAWFLIRKTRFSNGEKPTNFSRYLLFIGVISLATITVMLAFEHFRNPRDFYYLISAAYAKLAIFSLSAAIFGFFAVYVIEHPGYKHGSIVMALAFPILLYLLYRTGIVLFATVNNMSLIYLMLLILIGCLVLVAYRFGVFTTWTGCISAIIILSSQHNGWTLSTWNDAMSYLIFLSIFNLYIAFFLDQINLAQQDLIESKKREELVIRSMQAIIHNQNIIDTERMDQVVRDLHDEVGQGLVAASIYIRSLENSLESAKARRAFEKGSAMLESTSISIRNMLNSLNRQPANYAYLNQELASGRISRLLLGSGVGYHFTITPESSVWSEVSPEIYAYIHRFFQESATNILRHSRADQCRISLRIRLKNNHIRIAGSICDNDIQRNFNFNKIGSTGLDGLVQKTRKIGGILRYGRKPAFKKIGFLLQVPR